jgi:hypothetical protein
MSAGNPTNVTAVAISLGTVRVSWTNAQTTHDNNRVEYRNITDSGSWVVSSSTIAPTATTHNVTGLDGSKLYSFRVTALDSGGDSSEVEIARGIYTLPTQPGTYLISQIQNPLVNDWTHLAVVTGASPFLQGNAFPFSDQNSIFQRFQFGQFLWGPAVTIASYPALN